MNKLHSECHIAESDYPVAIRFLPSKELLGAWQPIRECAGAK